LIEVPNIMHLSDGVIQWSSGPMVHWFKWILHGINEVMKINFLKEWIQGMRFWKYWDIWSSDKKSIKSSDAKSLKSTQIFIIMRDNKIYNCTHSIHTISPIGMGDKKTMDPCITMGQFCGKHNWSYLSIGKFIYPFTLSKWIQESD